uniref:Uncharacterized protein n=1 Tax=Timema tahoe TaxID=61484 RepID=A0A7R9NUJ0_9NEOP|nr:unnamed protein product [Timema tahoe]
MPYSFYRYVEEGDWESQGGPALHFISARVNSASRLGRNVQPKQVVSSYWPFSFGVEMQSHENKRLAEEELLREAKRGAARASVSGPLGWVKCPLRPTNKRFLRNTILHTINNNSRHASKTRKNQDLRNKSVLSSNSKTSVDSTKYQPNKRVEGHKKTNKNKEGLPHSGFGQTDKRAIELGNDWVAKLASERASEHMISR